MNQNEMDLSLKLFKANTLFQNLSEDEIAAILLFAKEKKFAPAEIIIQEEEKGDEFYFIQAGDVEIVKKTTECESVGFRIATLHAGDTIGEIALLEGAKRTASARAITATTVLAFSVSKLQELAIGKINYNKVMDKLKELQVELASPPLYSKIALNLAKDLSQRLFHTNIVTANALREELKLAKIRLAMGRFLIIILALLVFYVYSLKIASQLASNLPSTSIISIPLIIIFAAGVIFMMATSGFPLSFYGLTTHNGLRAAVESVVWSIPAMILIVIIKWILIHLSLYPGHVFEGMPPAYHHLGFVGMSALIVAYLVFTPVQELIVRGGLQSCLQWFLVGPYRIFWAILLSNLLFSMAHLHLSIELALGVFFSGLFWGWMYARQKTLIGVSVSHLILGGWLFFIVGIYEIL